MSAQTAETIYLFRHALLRDAAYQLQLPGDRARLHALAFDLIEAVFGGRPDEGPGTAGEAGGGPAPHPSDVVALELAEHARLSEGAPAAAERQGAISLYLERGAEHAERNFRNLAAARAWLELSDRVTGSKRGEALRRGAVAVNAGGEPATAERLYEAAREAFQAAGDRRGEGRSLSGLASVLSDTARFGEAESRGTQALAIQRATGDLEGEALSLSNLAIVFRRTGRIADAERLYGQVLAVHAARGDRKAEATARGNLAVLHSQSGRTDEACRGFEQALAMHRELGSLRSEGAVLGNLAALYGRLGRHADCLQASRRALEIHRQTGNRLHAGVALANIAISQLEFGQIPEAGLTLAEALAVRRDSGDRQGEALVLGIQAALRMRTGRPASADRLYREALAILGPLGERRSTALHTCDHALCLLALGKTDDAAAQWARGARDLASLGDSLGLESKREAMREACARAAVKPFDSAPRA